MHANSFYENQPVTPVGQIFITSGTLYFKVYCIFAKFSRVRTVYSKNSSEINSNETNR